MYDIFEIETKEGQLSYWKNDKDGTVKVSINCGAGEQAGLTINAEEFERLKKWINGDD